MSKMDQIQIEVLDEERVVINGAELTDRREIFNLMSSLTRQFPKSSVVVIPRDEKFTKLRARRFTAL